MSNIEYRDLRFGVITLLFGLPLMALGVWWAIFLATLSGALISGPASWTRNLVIGAIWGFIVWFFWSAFAYFDGGDIITSRVSDIFKLHPILLLIMTGLIGAILGGLGGVTGSVRKVW